LIPKSASEEFMDAMSLEDLREMMESMGSLLGLAPHLNPYHHDHMRLLTENAQLIALAADADGIMTAAVFAGLTTCPELQSNLYRLEALVHAFMALPCGRNAPTPDVVMRAFLSLEETSIGFAEDPAEDVFIGLVSNRCDNFRTFEGLWESNAFFLQRFLDILDGMPPLGLFSQLQRRVVAMLRLSEALASRCTLQKYTVGGEEPRDRIPHSLLQDVSSLSRKVCFTKQDLTDLGIEERDLSPFICDLSLRYRLVGTHPSTTVLERRPIVASYGCWYVMLPSAIGAAVRIFIIDAISKLNMIPQLERQLAVSYEQHFYNIPLLGNLRRAPVRFLRNDAVNAFIADTVVSIDEGRFLHLMFLLDNFVDAHEGWLLGHNVNMMSCANAIGKSVKDAKEFATQSPGFKDGMTLIVGCGWGRSSGFAVPNEETRDWRIETISAPDLTTLSLSRGFDALGLWRLAHARDRLTQAGGILQNVNGLLNLYAWSKELKYHLVPHEQMQAETEVTSVLIQVTQNSLLEVRRDVQRAWDVHMRVSPEGSCVRVCKFLHSSYFQEDVQLPLYVSRDDIAKCKLRAVYVGERQDWWCDISAPEESDPAVVYHLFEAAVGWMRRVVPALETLVLGTPQRSIAWHLAFTSVALLEHPCESAGYSDLKGLIVISHDAHHLITLTIGEGFMGGFACEKNIAERSLVWGMVKGVSLLCERPMTDAQVEHIVDSIVTDEDARSFHALRAGTFLDYVAESLPKPIVIDGWDDASLRIGLGWLAKSRESGSRITGVDECTTYIARLLDHIWADIKKLLSGLARELLVEKLLVNIEAARVEENQWKHTIRACLAQHVDKEDVLKAATIKQYSLNAAMLGSRIAIEMALCECPLTGGANPGEIEVARLLAYASLMHHMGGYSDAIRYEAMPAEIVISHFGDVMMDHSFTDKVLHRFGNEMHKRTLRSAARKYGELFRQPEGTGSVAHLFEPEFNEAWQDEFGFSVDQCRAYIDHLENLALKQSVAVIRLHLHDLLDWESDDTDLCRETMKAIVDSLRLWPRPTWPSSPEGFSERDWQPWKFRRRLSVVERPLVQLDNTDDPLFLVAPDLIREGFVYVLRCSYEAACEEKRFKSHKMQRWIGARRNADGHGFNNEVAERLRTLGWTARPSVKLTEVLNTKLEDYGDVDVLAWKKDVNRVLVIECKDLGAAKTHGEIATQLQGFRGRDTEKGKPDRLKKHLNRLRVLRSKQDAVARFIGWREVLNIEGHLVFENLVPVAFSLDEALAQVRITEYDSLDSI
jgi:hypothetical protein